MISIKRYRVPVADLIRHVDPLSGWLWQCEPITPEEVNAAVAAGKFEREPWDTAKDRLQGPVGREFHIRRIAYFMKHGLPSDEHSVQLALDRQPNGREIGINNGNHRICAAQVRGDAAMDVMLYFFDAADIARLLPGALEL